MKYINYKFNNENETIDECKTQIEAIRLLHEYQLSDPFGDYWISNRKCKNYQENES